MSRASSPITTTIRGCTIAISSATLAMQASDAWVGSVSGHFTQSVPKTTIGSIASRLKLFISALPARP